MNGRLALPAGERRGAPTAGPAANRPAAGAGVAADAALAAALFAVDPVGTGGIALRAAHGPRRDAWLAWLRSLLPAATPWRRLPLHIADERLLGGLDLGATLHAGRPVAQRGVLAEADGGVLLLAMAERLAGATAARVAAAMDSGVVAVERDGIGLRQDARFGVVALDEGIGDEGPPASLLDRLAFALRLDAPVGADAAAPITAADVLAAQERLPRVTAGDDVVQALCAAALALGVPSLRASLLALRTARAAAALAGREAVDPDDAALAARLVLAPRATRLPAPVEAGDTANASEPAASPPDAPANAAAAPAEAAGEADESRAEAAGDADESAAEAARAADSTAAQPAADPSTTPFGAPATTASPPLPSGQPAQPDGALDDAVLAAAAAAIPAGLLAGLRLGQQPPRSPSAAAGRAGAAQHGRLRGRPNGVRRGQPTGGARLDVLETLRAAAPWQAIRRREDASAGATGGPAVRVRRDDFRVTRFKQRSVTTTLFVVDASGSAALHRLAEAKGAVELLLADCYVRRDNVALLAFRGRAAELLLPPTRSLVRAKRSLNGLPGGGGTPLAAAIDAASSLADAVRRRGETPIVVLLTDGRANIARDGTPGRSRAVDDALAAARRFRAAALTALLLDTSAQPQPSAAALAREMGAVYLPLPHAGAAGLSQAVLTVRAARDGADAGSYGQRQAG